MNFISKVINGNGKEKEIKKEKTGVLLKNGSIYFSSYENYRMDSEVNVDHRTF